MWNRIPDQIKRLSIPVGIIILLFISLRHFLIPSDFGKFGHYRASAISEITSLDVKYIGHNICEVCHEEITEKINTSFHENVMCEVCHGPSAAHSEAPDGNQLTAPTDRGYCPLCHEYLPSRPTGFPQIVSESHNPMKACISCHDPHNPKTPDIPKECQACHAEIWRTKAVSHHNYISCIRCHETPEEHKVSPREYRPEKPRSREFCGSCHAQDSNESNEISKIDMGTHGERYVCWQCHYPHMPEAK